LRTRDCYSSPDGTEHYAGTGVAGYLDLGEGWQPYMSTTKDGMDDQTLWRELMGYVFARIHPLLKQIEEREIYLALDGLALNLEEALHGKIRIEVDGNVKPMPADIDWGSPKGGEVGPSDEEDGSKEEKVKKSARTHIKIVPMTDDGLDNVLCRADFSQDSIIVLINKDHEVVQEALKAKPVNRMALNMLATREIATVIVENDSLLNRLFTKRVIDEIESKRTNGVSDQQYVARLLIDRVHKIAA
jgi:hypothetical protein